MQEVTYMGDDAELYMEMQEPGFRDWVERYNSKYEYDEDDEFEDEEEVVFKRYFLVDYENVNRDGLNGVTKLTNEDCVRIYYSEAAETLTFGLHRRINASKAHFDYIKVQMPIKNAVDCQILFDIRDLSKENRQAEYFIVSKDSDFDKAVEDFIGRKLKVKKVEEICKLTEKKATPEQKKTTTTNNTKVAKKKATNSSQKDKREAQIRSFFGQHFKKKIYVERKEEVIELLIKAKTKQEVNNGLLKHFANETVSAMLKTLEPLIKDLPGR